MTNSSLFICFTGIDGSGKSSQAQLLQKHLSASGISAVYTWSRWEPYLLKPLIKRFKKSQSTGNEELTNGLDLGKKKQRFLRNPIVLWLWLNLALFDYYLQVRQRVLGYRSKSNIVICDRYIFDFMVDQAVNMGKRLEGLKYMFRLAFLRIFPRPDLLFILDVDPAVGSQRKQDGTSVEYLSERQKLYYYYKDLPNARVIDANNTFESVTRQITEHTATFLRENGLFNG